MSLRVVITIFAAACCATTAAAGVDLPPPAARTVDYLADVRPIFKTHCYSCHGPTKQKSDYRLDSRSGAMKGGQNGIAIVPKDSAKSPLIHHVAGLDPDTVMPPEGDRLTAAQVSLLRAWIDQGAAWPDDGLADATPKHWAYQPLARTTPPVNTTNPIDAFVLAKLQQYGLTPSPQADKRTLIRRLTFDLHGLPPTPEEVAAFENDASPTAYESLVDRLLASPRYGERYARHWIDLVHFAESHGHDEDKPRPNAWPYRDYLVRSFNADKPYARFVEEQLAADALYPDAPDAIPALGFLAAGPWDQSSQMGIRENTVDRQIARNLDRDDMLTTTASTFLSTTVHCARCHNHKFDPISQAEYYNLQSCFAGVDRADRPFDPDPTVHSKRRAILERQRDVDLRPVNADGHARADEWERTLATAADVWTPLGPASFTSANGTKLKQLPDHSLLATENSPLTETYTITTKPALLNITAIRIEVLADHSLPMNGPGRAVNGNLHITEIKLVAGDVRLDLQNASADFDQQDWTSKMAIDGNPSTAWGIHPAEGQSHFLVAELKEPLESTDSLKFVIEQNHGRQHTVGRVRVSVTDAPKPVRANPVPTDIAKLLAIPRDQRTPQQRDILARHVLRLDLARELSKLPKPQMVFAGATDFTPEGSFTPARGCRPVFNLRRGDVTQPIAPAMPGPLTCIQGPTFSLANVNDEAQRRAALAKWITDPKNALTWRSIANRVWHYHFGKGLVDTPSDFGRMGSTPTHPELLDFLARYLQQHNGSLKQLHRLILTSNTFRQSSLGTQDPALRTDSDNRLLWRMNRQRLDAESTRDALLQISGKLDLTMHGPSVKQFIQTPGIHVTPNVDYVNFNIDDPANDRRSIYRFLFRTLPDPFMESMDCPDHSQLTPVRATSVTALQALAMLNDKLLLRHCEHLAERLRKHSPDPRGQIDYLYRLTLSRPPTERELARLLAHAEKHGLPNACRVMFNTNEFLFVD